MTEQELNDLRVNFRKVEELHNLIRGVDDVLLRLKNKCGFSLCIDGGTYINFYLEDRQYTDLRNHTIYLLELRRKELQNQFDNFKCFVKEEVIEVIKVRGREFI